MASNNENYVLKPTPAAIPIFKEWKIEKFVNELVRKQWFNIYQEAKALNEGVPSLDLEKKILDKIIEKFKELRSAF